LVEVVVAVMVDSSPDVNVDGATSSCCEVMDDDADVVVEKEATMVFAAALYVLLR
jgi:hypothetical protein